MPTKSSSKTSVVDEQKELQKVLDKDVKIIKKDLIRLVKALEGLGFKDFMRYIASPWRIMWTNLLAGIFRGLGILIGMTVVVAFLVWLLTQFVDFPLIGKYFQDLIELIETFVPDNGYR